MDLVQKTALSQSPVIIGVEKVGLDSPRNQTSDRAALVTLN
jgi:hypothetical protein